MDRDYQLHPRWQFLVARGLILFGTGSLIFSSYALWSAYRSLGPWHAASAVLFDAAGMLILEHPARILDTSIAFSLARVMAVCTAGLGVLFIVLGVYRESADQWRLRRVGQAGRQQQNLVVVCGLGRTGMQLVRDLRGETGERNQPVIVIESDPANPRIGGSRQRGAVVLVGDARDATVRSRARLELARSVFVVCGDDSTNLEIVSGIVAQVQPPDFHRGRPLRCLTHIGSPALAQAARDNPMFSARSRPIELDIFNMLENSARQLVKMELGRAHAPAGDEVSYYILVGFGSMGQAMALQAARLANFENNKRVRMTIIDNWSQAEPQRARDSFLQRFPAFCPDPSNFDLAQHVRSRELQKDDWSYRAGRPMHTTWRSDRPVDANGQPIPVEYAVNAEFLNLPAEVDAPVLIEALSARLIPEQQPGVKPCGIICFDDDRRNLESALRLSAALSRERRHLPLFAYLPNEPALTTLLGYATEAGPLGPLNAFGQRESSASYDVLTQPRVIELAELFAKKYLSGQQDPPFAGFRRDDPVFLRSDEEAGHHVDIKLAAVERMRARTSRSPEPQERGHVFSTDERHTLAIMEHNRYMAERLLDGWRYGQRDDVGKRRESLCPWQHLEDKERRKDFDQVDALSAWLAAKRTDLAEGRTASD